MDPEVWVAGGITTAQFSDEQSFITLADARYINSQWDIYDIMKRESLPIEALIPFARLYNIPLRGVTFRKLRAEDGTDKGGAVVATEDKPFESNESSDHNVLVKVPSDLILSLEMVQERCKYDQHLREVLEAVGDFAKVRPLPSLYLHLLVRNLRSKLRTCG